MIKHLLLFSFFLLFSVLTCAQDSTAVRIFIKYPTEIFDLKLFYYDALGIQTIKRLPSKDTLSFSLPKVKQGVFRLQSNKLESGNYVPGNYIDLIINGKENTIELSLDASKKIWLPIILQSDENKRWYSHNKEQQILLEKIKAINALLTYYPITSPPDSFFQKATLQSKKIIEQYQSNNATFIASYLGSWAALITQNTPLLITQPKDDFRIQKFEIHENFWNNLDTKQEKLLQTPIFTDAILSYLYYYMDPELQFSEEEMTSGFTKSCDIIMAKFDSTEKLRRFALDYLTLGFKEIGQEKVLQHLDETYRKEIQCSDNTQQSELQRRLKGYANLKPGTKAPAIEWTDADGSKQSLYDINATNTLVVFWASWCPHCMEQMPKLHAALSINANVKVIAISLDEDTVAYQNANTKLPNFTHFCDFKKWNSPLVESYFIAATPTFFLLDKDKNIIDKYSTYDSVMVQLSK